MNNAADHVNTTDDNDDDDDGDRSSYLLITLCQALFWVLSKYSFFLNLHNSSLNQII